MGQIEAKDSRVSSTFDHVTLQGGHILRRYTNMTTNIAESLNGILLDAKEMPIVALIKHIWDLLQRWFYERCTVSTKLMKPMTNHTEEQLKLRNLESIRLRVKVVNIYEFLVEERKITSYGMCSHYYTADAYRVAHAESIYIVLDEKQRHAPDDGSSRIVLPPR
nr:uncharacterized protein LOC125421556 [Ziziphus jujuba var. spinosa]